MWGDQVASSGFLSREAVVLPSFAGGVITTKPFQQAPTLFLGDKAGLLVFQGKGRGTSIRKGPLSTKPRAGCLLCHKGSHGW